MFEDPTQYYLVTELNPSGDLYTYLERNKGPLKEELAAHIIFETLYAINHCHQEWICHRDIKPQNILIDKDMRVKLIDFGIAY
jgi:serine/threonine protein kinase